MLEQMRILVLLFLGLLPALYAQNGDWPMYNRDPAGTRYSPLTQINTKNAAKLTQAWSYPLKSGAPGRGGSGSGSEVTPIVVNGVMYLPAAGRVVALQPETGKEIWRYDLPSGSPGNRGVTYWPGDKNNPPRIIFTSGHMMMALNAGTGKVDPGFGKEGQVDLVVPYNSPPTVYKNMLFVGANVPEINAPGLPGDTRAYDARTGAKVWEFHSVPRAGEPGNESWELPDSWKDRTGVNNWGFQMTVDAQRDTLYTTYGSPASDFYGGDRKGNDLYGNSVVALDVNTGKMKWYFQVVHHDVWDFDLPPAPGLIDVTIKGKKVPILAQTGKVGYMYILNRVTGEPIFGIKETPVPKSQVPGEQLSVTQPIPVRPPPFGRMNFNMEDLVTAADTNEEHAAACRDLVEKSGGAHNEGRLRLMLIVRRIHRRFRTLSFRDRSAASTGAGAHPIRSWATSMCSLMSTPVLVGYRRRLRLPRCLISRRVSMGTLLIPSSGRLRKTPMVLLWASRVGLVKSRHGDA